MYVDMRQGHHRATSRLYLISKSLPGGQKPIEGSNPSLSAIKKSQKKQDPADELGAKEKNWLFSTASDVGIPVHS
jgi:hypothetical protein